MHTGRRSVVTIGAYDGVHIGHRRVIEAVRRLATERSLESVVVTFDRHPASVVRPETAPKLLCDLDLKLELLAATGVDHVVVLGFDEERSNEPAEEFVEEVLGDQLSAAAVIVGRDFHFGKARGGDVALLERMGADVGFEVVPFGLVPDPMGGGIVSSTEIRRLIAAGRLEEAARLLDRPHEVRGSVAPGEPELGAAGAADVGAQVPDEPQLRAAGEGPPRTPSSTHFLVEVPTEILRPPPGVYRALAGPVADGEASSRRLVRSEVTVPAAEAGPLVVGPATGRSPAGAPETHEGPTIDAGARGRDDSVMRLLLLGPARDDCL